MKIPENAKRVFEGIIFDVYQWPQNMFDGSVKTFEMLKRPNSSIVIPVVGDKILIQIEEQPGRTESFISLPGGGADPGEEPLVTAQREFLEETGYVSNDWFLWKHQQSYFKTEWNAYFFIARDCKFQQPPQFDPGEKITTKLLSFDEFIMLSEDPRFHETDLIIFLLRARLDLKLKDEFSRLLFRTK